MAKRKRDAFDPEQFSGTARLFPLPNLVMFPHVLQPLHVFEPRYRELVQEALAGDQLLAMAMLKPSWEANYEGRPPLHPMACLGRIATHHKLKDGRYNLLLQGLCRVRIQEELPPNKLFREAKVELCPDYYSPDPKVSRGETAKQLLARFKEVLPQSVIESESMEQLLGQELPLGVLTDVMSYTIELDHAVKQSLLEATNVDVRAAILLERLSAWATDTMASLVKGEKFPPEFSAN